MITRSKRKQADSADSSSKIIEGLKKKSRSKIQTLTNVKKESQLDSNNFVPPSLNVVPLPILIDLKPSKTNPYVFANQHVCFSHWHCDRSRKVGNLTINQFSESIAEEKYKLQLLKDKCVEEDQGEIDVVGMDNDSHSLPRPGSP